MREVTSTAVGARLHQPRATPSIIQLLPRIERHADNHPAARRKQAVPRKHGAARRERVDCKVTWPVRLQCNPLACPVKGGLKPLQP